jgi:hypothetical protein
MRLPTLFLLLSAPVFAQSDTIMVMVRPAYTEYRSIGGRMCCGTEQYLIQEASFEGAIFDTINVEIALKESYYTAKITPPKWKKIKKKIIIPSKVEGVKSQKIKYETYKLLSPARLDSLFVPSLTIKRQRRIVRVQGNSNREVPACYKTITNPKCITDRFEFFYPIQHPAEYKIFPIK